MAVITLAATLGAAAVAHATTTAGCSEVPEGAQVQSHLPDCRVYELVSPPNKKGAEAGFITEVPLLQAAADGTAITYYTGTPITNDAQGNPEEDRVLSTVHQGAWSSRDISVPYSFQSGAASPREYLYFTPNLSNAVLKPHTPGAAELGLRDSVSGAYTLIDAPETETPRDTPEFLAASPDITTVVFAPKTNSGEEPSRGEEPSATRQLYAFRQGQRELVSVLPGEVPYGGFVGGEARALTEVGYVGPRNVSSDGTKVFWEAILPGHPHTVHLYMRNIDTHQTVQIDTLQGGSEEPEGEAYHQGAAFQTASASGDEVFFTDTSRLTAAAHPGDLYVFNLTSGRLADLTDLGGGPANVQGVVLGASETGSSVYFVATGALSSVANRHGDHALSGSDNLYVAHYDGKEWQLTYIATLSSDDAHDWEGRGSGGEGKGLLALTARVSPNGTYLAFMSDRPLTGYNTEDATAHTPDEEVYEYSALTNTLACASCNPAHPQPHGIYDQRPKAEGQGIWFHRWIAASIPGWTASGETERAWYQSRYLSNSGRLFFNSPEALVPQDHNGVEDVYQYEPVDAGGCGSESEPTGAVAYGGGGCLGLISGGTGSEESEFVDASETGNDVFFDTSVPLVAEDSDTNRDMYDAHVCSTEAPCAPVSVAPPEPCASPAACRPGTPAPLVASPGSLAVTGSGNLAPGPPGGPGRTRPLTAKQRLLNALKACRRHRNKKVRTACERSARRRFEHHHADRRTRAASAHARSPR